MKTFKAFFAFELKRFFSKKNTVVFFIFLLLALYFIQDGIGQYKHIVDTKAQFQEIEKVKVDHYINYTQYGIYGFRLLFIPSPLSVFFTNSSLITGMTANVDSADVLKIYNSFKGKNLYAEKTGGFKDFSGIILLFGTLLVLYFGYESFRHKNYVKFLASFSGYRQVFVYIQASRLILLLGYFFSVALIALGMIYLNGLSLAREEFFHFLDYFLVLGLVVIFLFFLGSIAGTIRSRFAGIALAMGTWFMFVFLLPGFVHQLVSKRAEDITSNYQLEFDKLKVVMAFEKRALDAAQRYTSMEERVKSERKLIEGFWDNEFKKIEEIEAKMHREMLDNYHFFRNISVFFPTTFYQSVGNEVGSRGYENFFSFYNRIQELKKGFVRFYFNKKFYSNYGKVESFIKGDENLYNAPSRLPGNFSAGLLLSLLYIMLLSSVSYFRYKSFLFYVPDKSMPELKKLNIELHPGRSEVVLTGHNPLKDQFYSVFSGEFKEFNGQLRLENKNLADTSNRDGFGFLYLCHPEEIPEDIRAGHLIEFFQDALKLSRKEKAQLYLDLNQESFEKKLFGDLEDIEKEKVLMTAAHLKKGSVCILDDFAKGMAADYIMNLIDGLRQLKLDGSAVLYLTADTMIVKKVGDSVTSLYDDPNLHKHLKTYRFLKNGTDNDDYEMESPFRVGED